MQRSPFSITPSALPIALLLAALCVPAVTAAPSPLEEVLQRVERVRSQGGTPVVVFDLDDTIFRTSYRTKAVLRDWAAGLRPASVSARRAVESLEPERMPYDLKDTLDMAHIHDPALRQSADKAWGRHFFGSDYMNNDRAIRGAPEYAAALLKAGATIVYLTARDAPRMKRGTLGQIAYRGFPKPDGGKRVLLMMKPDRKLKDVQYKDSVTAKIKSLGRVVASFDNEPRNLHMFRKRFPGASLIYVDTPHSADSPPLTPAMRTITDYSVDLKQPAR